MVTQGRSRLKSSQEGKISEQASRPAPFEFVALPRRELVIYWMFQIVRVLKRNLKRFLYNSDDVRMLMVLGVRGQSALFQVRLD